MNDARAEAADVIALDDPSMAVEADAGGHTLDLNNHTLDLHGCKGLNGK